MSETHESKRQPYAPPTVESEVIALATPLGGTAGFGSGPFRQPPPDEGQGGEG